MERKAKEIEDKLPGARFIVSNLFEKLAPEQDLKNGNNMADYWILWDWCKFRKKALSKGNQTRLQPKQIQAKTSLHNRNESLEGIYFFSFSQAC